MPALDYMPGSVDLRSSMQREHQHTLENLVCEADRMADCATRIANGAREILAQGGHVQIQPQMAFLTGCLMRITKDWSVLEHLQRRILRPRPERIR